MNAELLLQYFERLSEAPTRSPACADLSSTWRYAANWWNKTLTTNRRRKFWCELKKTELVAIGFEMLMSGSPRLSLRRRVGLGHESQTP